MEDLVTNMAEACARVTAAIDLDDALQAVVDEARDICRAQYGVLVAFEETGEITDIITSGFTQTELDRLWSPSNGWRLLEDLNRIEHPIRVADLPAYAKASGLFEGELPARSFLGSPLRHKGVRVGNIFLGGKQGEREFTQECEYVVGMFATQAAIVITNARTYKEEQRAKAELEALIDSSPLGILVFDAKTGRLVSVNEETRRLVGGMRGRDHSLEVLLEELQFQRPDGRELLLDELPLTRALSSGEAVRAEEVIISRPDGRSVCTLVNARPIYSRDRTITSVVVTLQDMTPLEEIERHRAEFLETVSLGLRTPLTTIKGATATALGSFATLEHAEGIQLFKIIDEQTDQLRSLTNDLIEVTRIEQGKLTITSEPLALNEMVNSAVWGFQNGNPEHPVSIDLAHGLPRVSAENRRVSQVLKILLDFASQLSTNSTTINVKASPMDSHVAITVASKGRGFDGNQLPHLFNKHYRLASEGSMDLAPGEGLRLAICKGIVETHGGRIWAESEGPDQGVQFTFTIPAFVPSVAPLGGAPSAFQLDVAPEFKASEQVTVLVVDDDIQTLRYVRNALVEAGYTSFDTGDPEEADRLLAAEEPDLVLLGATLPRTDGFGFINRIAENTDAPVIFLSERDQDQDIAKAFEMGAADYIVKPFSANELIARIRVALRGQAAQAKEEPEASYLLRDLRINFAERRVTVGDRPIKLTATEYDLLRELSNHAGRVLTHDHLLQRVWGPTYAGDSQLLRTYVKYLRQKLGDDANNPKYIFTEPRVGYRMARS